MPKSPILDSALPPLAVAFLDSINRGDATALDALFADTAVVNDAGRQFIGREAIKKWSEDDIFAARVTLEMTSHAEQDGETVLTTKVDGTFDRTGLPDPLFINQHLKFAAGKIVELTCKIA